MNGKSSFKLPKKLPILKYPNRFIIREFEMLIAAFIGATVCAAIYGFCFDYNLTVYFGKKTFHGTVTTLLGFSRLQSMCQRR